MKYQVGDEILVLHTQEEGKVLEIINDKMVLIEVKGVKFPAYMDQIDFPYFHRFTKTKLFPAQPKPQKVYIDQVKAEKHVSKSATQQHDGFWLSLLPVTNIDEYGDEFIELFKVYLLNHTGYTLNFTYEAVFFGKVEFGLKQEILPFNDFYVHDIPMADVSDSPKIDVTLSLKNPEIGLADKVDYTYKFKGKNIIKEFEQMQAKGQSTMKFQIFKSYPEAQLKVPETESVKTIKLFGKEIVQKEVVSARQYINNLPQARAVVDVHIEKITDSWQHLTNGEIIELQMREFEKWYDIAVMQNLHFFIVVHGVGNGVLRNEIHEFLKYKKEVKSFVNQYHPSFGYGATEIKF
jgi:hypothetical protein